MRIAFSGSHRVGKSSLIEALAPRLGFRVIDEPYHALEEDGHEFSDPPTIEDFEAQLRTSIAIANDLPAGALVDRCPLDFVAYLRALDPDYDIDLDALREAMSVFELVVFVPIEQPDRITVSTSEHRRLRADVDTNLRSLVLDDSLGLDLTTVEADGPLDARVDEVMRMVKWLSISRF